MDKSSPATPERIYVWLVRSEEVQDQPGSWRIRKWDIEPFPEANFALSETAAITDEMVERGARRMAQLVRAGIIEKPPLTEWEPWAGSVRAVLEAARIAQSSTRVACECPQEGQCLGMVSKGQTCARSATADTIELLREARVQMGNPIPYGFANTQRLCNRIDALLAAASTSGATK